MDDYTSLIYAVDGRVARITMNRPDKRNALNTVLRKEIVAALKAAERDDEVSVILIDGAGPAFCAGYDLSPDRSDRPKEVVSAQYFDKITDQTQRALLSSWLEIWDLLKPVVAKVHGACLAGGSELMSMCDIAFVADDARLGYPPMRNMSTPDFPYFAWKMPMAMAKYLQLTGNSLTGKEAAAAGWVAKSFPADDLEEATMREVRAMSSIPPDLLALNKLSLKQTYELMGFRTAVTAAAQWHAMSGTYRPTAGRFGDIIRADGLRAAIDDRDGPFLAEGIL